MERRGFPSWWVRKGGLKTLGASEKTTGQSIAALKVLLAIVIAEDGLLGDVRVTLTELEVVTGMTRPMVTAGLRILEETGFLRIDRTGYRNSYGLVKDDEASHYTKVPHALVRSKLRRLPNGTTYGLAALKMYLTLLTVRQRNSHVAPISHRKIQAYTAIRPAAISRGASLLIEHGFIRHTSKVQYQSEKGYPVNNYYVVGALGEGSDTRDDLDAGRVVEAKDEESEDFEDLLEHEL